MSVNNTPKNIGGQRTKGELSEQGAKSRANTIIRVKEVWGVSEFMDIFPRDIRPRDDLGTTAINNMRTISNLCPDLEKARSGMLRVCRNPDGSYKTFGFTQSKALVEQLKEMKNMLAAGGNQANKKKGGIPTASSPRAPSGYSSSTPASSPVKAKQAKKDKAQAAGQELLQSIGRASVEPSAAEDDECDSITVDTAPKRKLVKKSRGSLGQEQQGPARPPTAAPTAPVAVMSAAESPSSSKAATPPVAAMSAMSADGSQAPVMKPKPPKKARINVSSHDSDSEDAGDDTANPLDILDLLNGNIVVANTAGTGFGKPTGKPAKSRFATETIGRMVVPSRDLVHPFSTKHLKRSEQKETSTPPTVNKPVQIKKPFSNLMTAPPKPKTFAPPKHRLQKPGEMKKGLEMNVHPESGIQNVDSTKETQHNAVVSPAEVNNSTMAMEDVQAEATVLIEAVVPTKATVPVGDTIPVGVAVPVEAIIQVETTSPTALPTRTNLPTSPLKRTASTMLHAADEPNPQVERSIRARVEQRSSPYSEKAVTGVIQFERVITSFTEATIDGIGAYGGDGGDEVAQVAKAGYRELLSSFLDGTGKLKERLMEISEKDNWAV